MVLRLGFQVILLIQKGVIFALSNLLTALPIDVLTPLECAINNLESVKITAHAKSLKTQF